MTPGKQQCLICKNIASFFYEFTNKKPVQDLDLFVESYIYNTWFFLQSSTGVQIM